MGLHYNTQPDNGWVKVFRHNISGGLWTTWEEVMSNDYNNPNSDKFSIMDKIKNMKINGEWIFKMIFPDAGIENIWAQTHNPFETYSTGTPVPGYRPISIGSSSNSFGGLAKSIGTSAFMDCNPNSANWWYPIGAKSIYNGGIPVVTSGQSEIQLWVKIRD